MCIIRIFSATMYETLYNLGFTNNKSYDFHMPEIRGDLVRHYIRGYFDGDGCFTFTNKSFHINFITASKALNDDIIKILRLNNFNIIENSYVNNFGTIMYRPEMYSLQDKINFLNWIYEDCNVYLDRKYKKYLKVKEYYKCTQDGLAV